MHFIERISLYFYPNFTETCSPKTISNMPELVGIMVWHRTDMQQSMTWAPSQYPKRRLFVRYREISKPRNWYFKLSHRFEIWQAHRQQCCRSACQISERSDNSKYRSRGFEILRDLTKRRLFGYWDGALMIAKVVDTYIGLCDTQHRSFQIIQDRYRVRFLVEVLA